MNRISAHKLGIIWQRLTGLIDETAQAFIRTSFSSVVRDNLDMSVGLMDSRGRQFAQSAKSVPSFICTMSRTLAAMLERYPHASLQPGDVLISNDPYIGTGHLNDITMSKPVFRDGHIVAFLASVFHSVDIGGAPSVQARDAYEEGLTIPISKIVRGGTENEDVIAFITENLRGPVETLGDIRAQFSAYQQAEARLMRILADEGIDDLDGLVDEIFDRSEASMRRAIESIPDGCYEDEIMLDGFEEPLRIHCTVTVRGSEVAVDYAGSSAQIDRPVNSVFNYTIAYTSFALKCLLDPSPPSNDGTFRPVTITAPEGSLVNPRRPAPVWARHLTGHYLPPVIFGALASVLPRRVIADCGSPLWNVYFHGRHRDGRPFMNMYFMNGGQGARDGADGAPCLSFPSNVAAVSVERFESLLPLMVTEKALREESGGGGRFRGGAGQRIGFKNVSDADMTVTIRHERVRFPPRGLLGGGAGAPGRETIDGQVIAPKGRYTLKPQSVVVFETPGGGGMYAKERNT